jgi:hypothetical protein
MQLPPAESGPNLADMQRREDVVLKKWVSSHLTDFISYRSCDPENPFPDQRIDTTIIEAKPSLEKAIHHGIVGMGKTGYEDFIDDLIKNKAVDTVISNRNKGLSTLIASLHMRSTWDTAFTHNGVFVASQDPEFAEDNVIIANPMMTRMALAGVSSVPEFLSWSGKVLLAPPEQAMEYGMDNDVFEYRMWKAGRKLVRICLKDSAAVHRAPTATRTETIILDDDTSVENAPRVSDENAEKIIRYTPWVIGIPMHVEIGKSSAQVLQPKELKKVEDVHKLMQEMVEVASDLSRTTVVYGQEESSKTMEELESGNGQPLQPPDVPIDVRTAPAAA